MAMTLTAGLQAGLSVGSALLNSSAARRSAKNQRRELAQRQQEIQQTAELSASEVLAAGRGAAAPLQREAELLRDAEKFRNPIVEQALTESVRRGAGEMVEERASVARNPTAARTAVARDLFNSRALTARESARVERLTRLQGARAQLFAQAGQFTTQAAGQAANIRANASQTLAALPFPETATGAGPAMMGGILSAFDSLSDEDRAGLETQLSDLLGLGGGDEALDDLAEFNIPDTQSTPAWMRPGAFDDPNKGFGSPHNFLR